MTIKTRKDIFEVYKPKSEDEQRFVDKHITIKHKDRNGNGDDVFNASKIKKTERKKERHGYEPGADEAVYEGAAAKKTADLMLVANGTMSEHEYAKKWKNAYKSLTPKSAKRKKFFSREDVEFTEEEIDVILSESLNTIEHKGYTFKSSKALNGMGEGPVERVSGHGKAAADLGISLNPKQKYAETRLVTVTNAKTGKSSYHHVYQSGPGESGNKPTISVRTIGRDAEHQAAHQDALKGYLEGKGLKESFDIDNNDNLDEAVEVVKNDGMLHVHDGTHQSFPIHARHQKQIAGLSKGEKTSYHDVNGTKTHAERTGALVHLKKEGEGRTAAVAFSHFKTNESVEELDELSKAAISGYFHKAQDQMRGNLNSDRKVYRTPGVRLAKRKAEGNARVNATEGLEESAGRKDGYYHVDHSGVQIGDVYRDSNYAVRAADKHEDKTGKVQTVHHVKGGKIQKTWQFSDSQQRFAPHSDFKGDNYSPVRAANEDFEQIDELSKGTLKTYVTRSARDIEDRAYWSGLDAGENNKKPYSQYPFRKQTNRIKGITTAAKKLANESLDESIASDDAFEALHKMGAKSIRTTSEGIVYIHPKTGKEMTLRHSDTKKGGRTVRTDEFQRHSARLKEDTELTELSRKTLGDYAKKAHYDADAQNRAGDRHANLAGDLRRAGDNDSAKHHGKKAADRYRKSENRHDGVSKAIDKLTKEDIINRVISTYIPEELTNEERMIDKISNLSEGHIDTLLDLFGSLSEENQLAMISAASTREGIAELLDFAIQNRGE